MKKIVFATTNKNKFEEVKKIFNGSNIELLSLDDFPKLPEIIEDGNTFEENSLIKVRTIFDALKIPTIGDDSGLTVEQLNGRPGVFSARYAGENATYELNNKKLLKELEGFPEPHFAAFVCAASYYDGKHTITAFGKLEGEIIKEYRGKNGFGYDPIFKPLGFNSTLAEMTTEEKNKISHRGKAFEQLKRKLVTEGILETV